MLGKAILVCCLIIGKTLYPQDIKCDLLGYLHHDTERKLIALDNNLVNVNMLSGKYFDFNLKDFSVVFSTQKNEITIGSVDAISFSIRWLESDFFLFDKNDTVNLSKAINNLTNIDIKSEFVSNRKIGRSTFLNFVYRNAKVDKIEIFDLHKNISL